MSEGLALVISSLWMESVVGMCSTTCVADVGDLVEE